MLLTWRRMCNVVVVCYSSSIGLCSDIRDSFRIMGSNNPPANITVPVPLARTSADGSSGLMIFGYVLSTDREARLLSLFPER